MKTITLKIACLVALAASSCLARPAVHSPSHVRSRRMPPAVHVPPPLRRPPPRHVAPPPRYDYGMAGSRLVRDIAVGLAGAALLRNIITPAPVVVQPAPVVVQPAYVTRQVWIPASYVTTVGPDGTVTRTYVPGRYETVTVPAQ